MDFVFLSTQGWAEMGGAGRPIHYLARELLARGARVLFIEVVASAPPPTARDLTVLSFHALGYDEHALRRAWFGLDAQRDARANLARALDAFETPGAARVVVYGDPFIPFVEWFELFRTRGYKIVYDALDDFGAFPEIGLYWTSVPAERYLVAQSDLVIAVSTTLVEKLAAWNPRAPIQLVRQGFDPATFTAPGIERVSPRSAARAPAAPLLGFWGHVNAFNIDVPLVEYIAHARPAWQIQLLGPVDQDPALPRVAPALRALPNVQLPGPVPHADLPRYLQHFDVALVPFPDNAFNRARDPLKVWEYLSGYVPVVAAHTPQLRDMPYVSVAGTPEEFLELLERALTLTPDPAVVDTFLAASTWAKRLAQLLSLLEKSMPASTFLAPDTQAWYSDSSLAPNVREYIARTETLLQERTAYLRALEADSRAKQTHIDRLQQFNPIWSLKRFFDS